MKSSRTHDTGPIHTGRSGAPISTERNTVPIRYVRRHIDLALFLIVFSMICYGFVMLFSASMTEGFASENVPLHFIGKHLTFTALGTVIALLVGIVIPIRFFDRFWMTVLMYLGATFLMLAVYFPSNPILRGISLNGANRWISIMGVQFQPTEIAKFALVFCFAGYTSWAGRRRASGGFRRKTALGQAFYDGWIDIALPALLIVFWMALILLEPHISCIVILSLLSFFLFISAGIPWRSWLTGLLILLVIALVIAAVFAAILPMLPDSVRHYVDYDYVMQRLSIFNDIDSVDPDASFQTRQSISAIGSGGLFGVGFGESIQKWGYLPMQYNDYVFSIIAEELGLLGAAAVLLLFALYLIMGIRIAGRAAGHFAPLVAFGYAVLIPIQAFLNIGVAANVIPPTGITLPFFSYGGTSTLIFIVCVGFLLSVSKSGARPAGRERG